MTLEEIYKQVVQLTAAIENLCKEADSDNVVLNSLLESLVKVLVRKRYTPAESLQLFHFYLNMISSPSMQIEMNDFMSEIIKQSKKG